MSAAAEQAVLQAAVERGFVTPAQAAGLAPEGGALARLGQILTAAQVAELREVYQAVVTAPLDGTVDAAPPSLDRTVGVAAPSQFAPADGLSAGANALQPGARLGAYRIVLAGRSGRVHERRILGDTWEFELGKGAPR